MVTCTIVEVYSYSVYFYIFDYDWREVQTLECLSLNSNSADFVTPMPTDVSFCFKPFLQQRHHHLIWCWILISSLICICASRHSYIFSLTAKKLILYVVKTWWWWQHLKHVTHQADGQFQSRMSVNIFYLSFCGMSHKCPATDGSSRVPILTYCWERPLFSCSANGGHVLKNYIAEYERDLVYWSDLVCPALFQSVWGGKLCAVKRF